MGARLALFPEAFLPGYPRGMSFGAVVGNRTPEGRDHFRRYWEASVDVPGRPSIGSPRSRRSDALFLVVARHRARRRHAVLHGAVLRARGTPRQASQAHADRRRALVWGFGDGSTLPVFDTPLGRIGAVICWENYMPLLRMAMYAKGVQIYCAPTADGRETWLPTMRHVASEGRCFVLSCNQFRAGATSRPTMPDELADAPDDVSCAAAAASSVRWARCWPGPAATAKQILMADLDLDDVARGKFDFDVVGHYARPDIFRLTVDEEPKAPVVTPRSARRAVEQPSTTMRDRVGGRIMDDDDEWVDGIPPEASTAATPRAWTSGARSGAGPRWSGSPDSARTRTGRRARRELRLRGANTGATLLGVQADQILAFRLARSGLAQRDANNLADAAACPASDFARDAALLALAARHRQASRARTTTRPSTAASSSSRISSAARSMRSRPATSRSTAAR